MSRAPDQEPTAVLGRRLVAHLLDAAVYLAAVAVPFLLLGERSTVDLPGLADAYRLSPDYAVRVDDQQFLFERTDLIIVAAVAFLVVLAFEVITQGRGGWTIGKAVTGIRTVDAAGGRPGIGRAFVRTLFWVIDAIPSYLVPVVGGFFVLVTRTNRRVGDLVAGTYVVHKSAVGRFPDGSEVIDPETWEPEEPLPVTTLAEGEALRVGDPQAEGEATEGAEASWVFDEDAAEAPSEKPSGYQPRWDPRRKAYLQWDPRRQSWLQYDEDASEWRPIS